jgi:hypothetical protein
MKVEVQESHALLFPAFVESGRRNAFEYEMMNDL